MDYTEEFQKQRVIKKEDGSEALASIVHDLLDQILALRSELERAERKLINAINRTGSS